MIVRLKMAHKEIIVAFDLYGTLLSAESIVEQLADYTGQEKAQSIAAAWRRYQLEYTWRLNSMGKMSSHVHRICSVGSRSIR